LPAPEAAVPPDTPAEAAFTPAEPPSPEANREAPSASIATTTSATRDVTTRDANTGDVSAALLAAHPRAVADRVLDEESARRRHLVIALSGAHAYGFPSPDSDLDLKAVH